MISLLVPVRKNSPYLVNFLISFLKNTYCFDDVELIILISKEEKWNLEIIDFLKHDNDADNFKVMTKELDAERDGLHLFWNQMAKEARGNWLWYLCDDFYLYPNYDKTLNSVLKNLDSDKINVIVPRVENSGSITHVLSRGYYNAVGMGKHGNMDSYINWVLEAAKIENCITHISDPILLDFSRNDPLSEENSKLEHPENPKYLAFYSDENQALIKQDAEILNRLVNI